MYILFSSDVLSNRRRFMLLMTTWCGFWMFPIWSKFAWYFLCRSGVVYSGIKFISFILSSLNTFTEKSGFCCSNLAIWFNVTGNFIPEISKLFKSLMYCDGLWAFLATCFLMYKRQYKKFLSSLFLIFTVAFLLWICFGKGVCDVPPTMSYVAIFSWQSKMESSVKPEPSPSWLDSSSLMRSPASSICSWISELSSTIVGNEYR